MRVLAAELGGETDRAALLERVRAAARATADAGAELLILPQFSTLPYFPRGAERTRDHYNLAERGEGESLAVFQEAASAGTWLCGSYYETLAEGVFYCRAVLVRPDRRLAATYRQVHIDWRAGSWETFYLQPGRGGFTVTETPLGRTGALLGSDALHPTSWRALAEAGAKLALVGLSEPKESLDDVLRQATAAAAANEIAVVIANRRGEEFGVHYPGASIAIRPDGTLLEPDRIEPDLSLFELDLASHLAADDEGAS